MTKFHATALAAGLSLASFAPPAAAQNVNLNPSYGTFNLRMGFQPDPARVGIDAGGPNNASQLGSGCAGFIADPPDMRLNYTAGAAPLIIRARSNADTTLVVNGPGGNWSCNDDNGRDLNPELIFSQPASGQYDIWVGTFSSTSTEPAEIEISEVNNGGVAAGAVIGATGSTPSGAMGNRTASSGTLNPNAQPNFGTVNLAAGFMPDPQSAAVQAGGSINASSLGSACSGFVSAEPDLRLNFSSRGGQLFIRAVSGTDTTLVVSDPNGNWQCNDDDTVLTSNPEVHFVNAPSGQYDIWVGTYGGAGTTPAQVQFSESEN